jgi:tRNA modification GTPase
MPEDLLGPALNAAQQLRDEIAAALADGRRGERLRDGLVVAIAGPPNAGKSTLFNRLARREAAIVSPYAGTTRDILEVHLDLDGYPVTLLDTAGIRDSVEPVEQEGVRRARERAATADLVLWLCDVSAAGRAFEEAPDSLTASEIWRVGNKSDLSAGNAQALSNEYGFKYWISAASGKGVDALVTALAGFAREYFSAGKAGESVIVTRARHRRALEDTVAALERALNEAVRGLEREELVAEELRVAATTLGRLTGRVDVEDILEVIFRDFCIGK